MSGKQYKPLGLVIYGACGRMGSIVTELAAASEAFRILALVERQRHPLMGNEVTVGGGKGAELKVLDHIPEEVSFGDVILDFSSKEGFRSLIKAISRRHIKLVSGTTGLGTSELAQIRRYAKRTAVFYDSNMSFGIAVMKHLLGEAKPLLAGAFDVEIIESHHRYKRDLPSGTALSLASELTGKNMHAGKTDRNNKRDADAIKIHSLRAGGIIGEHKVVFASDEELISLSHEALSRRVFAVGALRAAVFLNGKEQGLYSMKNLLETYHG